MSASEIIPIVDLHDEIIGYKKRKDITPDDIYRITGCRITDEQGNILLAQRSFSKKHNPGKRGPAVAGTVAKDETYLDNIIKELKEEIGLDIDSANLQIKVKRYSEYNKRFCQRFLLIYKGNKKDITIQVEEVEQIKRYQLDGLKRLIGQHPEQFTPGTIWAFNNL